MRVAIYARSASRSQRNITEEQVRRCKAEAASKGWHVVGAYIDECMSGARRDRPGLQCLLRDAASGCFDRVLMTSVDRAYRYSEHLIDFTQSLARSNVSIATLNEGKFEPVIATKAVRRASRQVGRLSDVSRRAS